MEKYSLLFLKKPGYCAAATSCGMRYISAQLDGSVAFYLSCRLGICKECMVKVNGKAKLACTEIVTGDIVLDPVAENSVIKDLICHTKKKMMT